MDRALESFRSDRVAQPLRTTMLELVVGLWRETDLEVDVVRVAAERIRTGRVVLIGNFAGQREMLGD